MGEKSDRLPRGQPDLACPRCSADLAHFAEVVHSRSLFGGGDLRRPSGERGVGRLDRAAEKHDGNVFFPVIDFVVSEESKYFRVPQASLSPLPLWYWLSLAAFILAMLSKGSVVVLPVLLLGILWWLRSLTRRDMLRIAPFFLLSRSADCSEHLVPNAWRAYRDPKCRFCRTSAGGRRRAVVLSLQSSVAIRPRVYLSALACRGRRSLWWLPLLAALIITAVLWRYRNGWSRPLLFAWGFFCVALCR